MYERERERKKRPPIVIEVTTIAPVQFSGALSQEDFFFSKLRLRWHFFSPKTNPVSVTIKKIHRFIKKCVRVCVCVCVCVCVGVCGVCVGCVWGVCGVCVGVCGVCVGCVWGVWGVCFLLQLWCKIKILWCGIKIIEIFYSNRDFHISRRSLVRWNSRPAARRRGCLWSGATNPH